MSSGEKLFYTGQPEHENFRRAYAERKAPLVIICGSGLSAPAGLPTWQALRKSLEDAADRRVIGLGQIGEAMLGQKLNAAKSHSDNWVSFQLLKEVLTPSVFESIIEHQLSVADDTKIPSAYTDLMKLRPTGFVTLNLDRFSGDAISSAYENIPQTPIYGNELAKKWNLLRDAKVYLVYLHGSINDPNTWVMTHSDISDLLNSVGHGHFLRSVF